MANTPLGFPFGFYVADNTPIDGKYGIIDAGAWRPYNNTAEAIAEITAGLRYRGLTVSIAGVEYWWKDGTADGQLVVKSLGTSVTFGTSGQIPAMNVGGTDFVYDADFSFTVASNIFKAGQNITTTPGAGIFDHMTLLGLDHVITNGAGRIRWATVMGEFQKLTNTSVNSAVQLANCSIIGGNSNEIKTGSASFSVFNAMIVGGALSTMDFTAATETINSPILFARKGESTESYTFNVGYWTKASGFGSIVFGIITDQTSSTHPGVSQERVTAAGRHAVNISANSQLQTAGHGAYGDYSFIAGGIDANIPSTSPRSVTLGGDSLKMPDNTPDTAMMQRALIVDRIDSGGIPGVIVDDEYYSSLVFNYDPVYDDDGPLFEYQAFYRSGGDDYSVLMTGTEANVRQRVRRRDVADTDNYTFSEIYVEEANGVMRHSEATGAGGTITNTQVYTRNTNVELSYVFTDLTTPANSFQRYVYMNEKSLSYAADYRALDAANMRWIPDRGFTQDVSVSVVNFHSRADAGLAIVFGNNVAQYLSNSNRNKIKFDATLKRQVMVFATISVASTSANSPRLIPSYSIDGGANWIDIGAGTVASGDVVNVASATSQNSNWIDLPSGAKAPVEFRVTQHGGDNVASATMGMVGLMFR